jgi:hypothetical protein
MGSRLRRVVLGPLLAVVLVACGESTSSQSVPAVQPLAIDTLSPGALTLPNRPTSVKFAVIGDSGRGTPPQYDIAVQMAAFREKLPYQFVIMLGDNLY